MKIIKTNAVVAALLGAGALLMTPVIASASEAGQGWDAFNAGDGERITVVTASAYMGTSLSSPVGQGWDTFNSGDGQKTPAPNPAFMGIPPESVPRSGADIYGNSNFGE